MAGDLYLPTGLEADAKIPAIVFIAGTSGTKKGTPAGMATSMELEWFNWHLK